MGISAINGKNHGKISYKLGKIMGKSAINGKNHGKISFLNGKNHGKIIYIDGNHMGKTHWENHPTNNGLS